MYVYLFVILSLDVFKLVEASLAKNIFQTPQKFGSFKMGQGIQTISAQPLKLSTPKGILGGPLRLRPAKQNPTANPIGKGRKKLLQAGWPGYMPQAEYRPQGVTGISPGISSGMDDQIPSLGMMKKLTSGRPQEDYISSLENGFSGFSRNSEFDDIPTLSRTSSGSSQEFYTPTLKLTPEGYKNFPDVKFFSSAD
ncbi:uncharacterized protein MELLADRAFT_102972 [Melampsora larici-populina 98AG31]|uniref:Secreted protein n=1 Tax=Melampsora larici-populina (strain 98AG31 / pathotype 3-4-7) TaxID=747676 RepID=F4RA45_MELLP|nr:uncharacterized protein MELLADRAFT_102972 [Melampsora larici-populina 98AG31]EGG10847.1 hypothetical protein MELLADRAFT_102972 [Melampsora larici-populina 98AG31]